MGSSQWWKIEYLLLIFENNPALILNVDLKSPQLKYKLALPLNKSQLINNIIWYISCITKELCEVKWPFQTKIFEFRMCSFGNYFVLSLFKNNDVRVPKFNYRISALVGTFFVLLVLPHAVWASLVAQLVKNPPAMQETPVWLLGQEDPLGKG